MADAANTPEVPAEVPAIDVTKLTTRERHATVKVEIYPRDVAILSALSQGDEQEDMATRFEVSRVTILKVVTRLYAKLGTRKAPHAVAIATMAGVITPNDFSLSRDELIALYAADRHWDRVGKATLADVKSEGESDNDVTVRVAEGDERESLKRDAEKAQREAKARG